MFERCPILRSPIAPALLLLACAPAAAQQWDAQAGVASAQVTRGLAYIDQPLAEVSGGWSNEGGWSVGVLAARAFSAPQSTLAANVGYGWPLAAGIDGYVALGHADYRREDDWRLRYHDARLTINVHDRLFLSVQNVFDVQRRSSFGAGSGAGTLAKEAVWRQPLPHGLALVTGVGHAHQRSGDGFSYWYGNVGLRAALGGATVDAGWIGAGSAASRRFGSQADSRWVASMRWNF